MDVLDVSLYQKIDQIGKNVTRLLILSGVVLAAAIVLIAVVSAGYHYTKQSALVEDSACINGVASTSCYVGYRQTTSAGTQICATAAKRTGASCSNHCFNSSITSGTTTCDANNVCVSSNPVQCKGYCPSDEFWGIHGYPDTPYTYAGNADWFPIKSWFVEAKPTWNSMYDPDQIVVGNNTHYFCYANVRFMVMYQIREVGAVTFFEPSVSGAFPCNDLLDTNENVVSDGCIVSTSYDVDSDFIKELYRYTVTASAFRTSNVTGRVCYYHYACAGANTSIFDDPYYIGKRAVVEEDRQIPSYAGLLKPTPGEPVTPLHSPSAREFLARQFAEKLMGKKEKKKTQSP